MSSAINSQEVKHFENYLEDLISQILQKRPANPYGELIYLLYSSMGEDLQGKSPSLQKFCQEFKSEMNEVLESYKRNN
jgi:hypothetical protein